MEAASALGDPDLLARARKTAVRKPSAVLAEGVKVLDPQDKVGPWECHYHHSRACFEMIARLSD